MKKTFLIFLMTFSFLVGFDKVSAYEYDYENDKPILSYKFGTNKVDLYYIEEVNRLFFHRNNGGDSSEFNNKTISLDTYPYFTCKAYNGIWCFIATGEFYETYVNGEQRTYIPEGVTFYSYLFTYNDVKASSEKHTGEYIFGNMGVLNSYNMISNFDIRNKETNEIVFNNSNLINKPSFEYNFSSNGERQLFSLDFYFTEEDLNLNRDYEIDITNLDKERYSIFHLDNFLYYGLVNDNGLYHWEEIQPNNKDIDHNNWIEDYEEVYKCNNNHIIDNCGFNLKFKNIGIDFIDGKYEKIRFSVTFANAINYDLKIKSPYELTKDNFYYNRIGQENFVLKNNTQDFPYLIFSTKKDNLVNSIFSEYDSDNHILYASYFDTENGSSLDSILDFESQHKEFKDNIPFNIGLSNKKGLWISSNHDDFFDYYVYYDGFNLYYSLNSNHDLEDSIYIDNSGNNVILPLIPQEGDKYYDDKFISSFKRVFKKIVKTLNYILDNIKLFFDNLPLNFQEYYIFIFGFIIFLIVIKFIL